MNLSVSACGSKDYGPKQVLCEYCDSLSRAVRRRPTQRTATRVRLVLSSAVGEQQKTHAICCIFQLDVLLLGQAIRRKGGFVNFAERKSGTFPYTPQSTSLVPTNAEPMFGVGGLNGFLRYGRGLHLCLLGMGLPEPSFDKRSLRSVAF